jgi:hypothetical protein
MQPSPFILRITNDPARTCPWTKTKIATRRKECSRNLEFAMHKLEIKELHVQISGRPEQRAVETLAPNRADQPFDEWMRQRHVRHRLDGFHVEDSQMRLLLVESVQRIMIRAEVGRRRLATHRSIEHLAHRDAIHDAAVHAKARDAPRTLVHYDEHPLCVGRPIRTETDQAP